MKKLIMAFAGLCLWITNANAITGDPVNGQRIFSSRCTGCHAVDRRVVGPALMNVYDRHDEAWIIAFVHSSQKVINSGDTTAKNLFMKFNQTVMPNHPDLSDQSIRDIISYIKVATQKLSAQPAPVATHANDNAAVYKGTGFIHHLVFDDYSDSNNPISFSDYGTWAVIFGFIVLLVITLLIVVKAETFITAITLKYGNGKSQPLK